LKINGRFGVTSVLRFEEKGRQGTSMKLVKTESLLADGGNIFLRNI
jgi:hypothetical protein